MNSKPGRTSKQRQDTASTFTQEEREAMREREAEQKRARARPKVASEEADVLEKIEAMSASDRSLARRIHQLIREHAPELAPRLWYGMPAYAKGGKVLCFFQGADKFKVRYSTLGFTDQANLDEGQMWPTAFALNELTAVEERRIAELVRRAASQDATTAKGS